MSELSYMVILEPNEDNTGYTVTVPALPGCVSVGDSVDEALENIKDSILLWINIARQSGEEIPQDKVFISKVTVQS